MKALVIGSGGRENAICKKLSESKGVEKIYIAPGNGGSYHYAENIDIDASDVDKLTDFAKENDIDLTIVGPEDALAAGIVDQFEKEGLKIFGPDIYSAKLESSKTYAKEFMKKHGIATGRYEHYDDYHEAVEAIKEWDFPLVIKADGLCAGKGVEICNSPVEAIYAIKDILLEKKFGDEGNQLIIEEYLTGYEASVFCIASGGRLHYFGTAKDYKRQADGDQGRNTGGMGCFSPNLLFDKDTKDKIKTEIIPKIEKGLLEENHNFNGVLFIGFMVTESGPKVLEFNVRFGDPETQVLLPRLESDFYEVIDKAVEGKLEDEDLKFSDQKCMTVIVASGGYPEGYETGYEISGLDEFDKKDLYIIHAGTKREDGKTYTSGGRVLSIVAIDDTLDDCREKIYKNIDKISFTKSFYRKDIGSL